MNSTFKTLIPIALVVALVSGVTFISQFSGTTTTSNKQGTGADASTEDSLPPLFFDAQHVQFDPEDSTNIANRAFNGFFEIGDTIHWVTFWFRNEKPYPVKLAVRDRTCTSCTSAKAAIVRADSLDQQALGAALHGMPWALSPLPDLSSAALYAQVDQGLTWHHYDFISADEALEIPAGSPSAPTRGVLCLGFTAKAEDQALTSLTPKTVGALVSATGPDNKPHMYEFKVSFVPRPPFDIVPVEAVLDDFAEGAPPQQVDVYVYSTTRLPSEINKPILKTRTEDPTVKIGAPVPLNSAETDMLVRRAKTELKANLRVEAGYRVPVTVSRDVPDTLPDIGKFEKVIDVAVPGTNHTARILLRGKVTGLVQLERGDKIDLGSYNSSFVTRKEVRIYTTRQDLELELERSRCEPLFVQYDLSEPEISNTRKYWTIKMTIPANEGRKPRWEGTVALRAKIDGKQAGIRMPVTGNGFGN